MIHRVKLSQDYRLNCIRPFQSSGEWIEERILNEQQNITMFFRSICCMYNRWENCISKQLTIKCGQESSLIFPYLIHFNSIDLIPIFCPKQEFDPDNLDQCKKEEYEAPDDFRPKGWRSNSLISHLFSYYCPNVGYGIDLNKDN